jgi:putative CocE/NonD family hydrolase
MPGMRVDQNVDVRMRDGVVLRADVYRPENGQPVPALVNRTPYDRTVSLIPPAAIEPEAAVAAGFAVVCQDVRGQYGSDGEFYTFVDEPFDGYDTVEWVAAQEWCDGAVGMVGRSYGATCQWLAASERPPHLRAICPVVTGSDFFRGWVYQGGAFQLGFNLFWVWMMSDQQRAAKAEELFAHLPLRTVPLPDPKWARFYFDWLDHATDDDYWQALSINRRYARIEVPAFNVGGWFDVFLGGTLENFVRMRGEGGSEAARTRGRLLIGPWAHGSTYGPFPDHSFNVFERRDAVDFLDLQLRFFDHHLRGENGAYEDEPPVQLFVMGENRWRREDDWPLARALETPWFLRAEGRLTPDGPGSEDPDEYVYDPRDPAPTIGGPTSLPARRMKANSGPLDQRDLAERADVLVYTSDVLEQPLEVTGPLSLVLYAATEGRDTDFVAKLVDVRPDGQAIILAEGALRSRFREGFDRERPAVPGRAHEYTIDLAATSNVFLPGHRMGVLVTSSSFPRFDRNPNTGNPLGLDGPDDLRPVRQSVFHDSERPSRILLAIVPR